MAARNLIRARAGALVVVAVLAACGADDEPPRPALTPSRVPDAVGGIGVSVSDVEGEPDVALWDGWVLALPAAAEAELWQVADVDAPEDVGLPYATALVDAQLVEGLGAEIAPIGAGGEFTLRAGRGDYLVCRAGGEEEPASIQGCGRLGLAPGDTIILAVGEGGTRVRHADPSERPTGGGSRGGRLPDGAAGNATPTGSGGSGADAL